MANKHPQLTDKWIGQRIHQRRKELQLTQADLASRLNVSPQQIQKYERAINRVATSRLFDIATALTVSPDWFLIRDHRSTPSHEAHIPFREQQDADFITTYLALSPEQRAAIRTMVRAVTRL